VKKITVSLAATEEIYEVVLHIPANSKSELTEILKKHNLVFGRDEIIQSIKRRAV
jgi:hypothetical protein